MSEPLQPTAMPALGLLNCNRTTVHIVSDHTLQLVDFLAQTTGAFDPGLNVGALPGGGHCQAEGL